MLEGATKAIHNGRVRNILFGVYHDDARLSIQLEASARITVLLSALGYHFYDVYDCGRGNHGVATCPGPVRFDNSSLVLEYLRRERPEGWHAMMLASLPAAAQRELKAKARTRSGIRAGGRRGESATVGSEGGAMRRGGGEETEEGGRQGEDGHSDEFADGMPELSVEDLRKVLAGSDEELRDAMARIGRINAIKAARHAATTRRKRESGERVIDAIKTRGLRSGENRAGKH